MFCCWPHDVGGVPSDAPRVGGARTKIVPRVLNLSDDVEPQRLMDAHLAGLWIDGISVTRDLAFILFRGHKLYLNVYGIPLLLILYERRLS